MSPLLDLILRTVSTLIATLATATIITERQRRILNAKVELAARHVECVAEKARAAASPPKVIVRDLQLAEEMIHDVFWSRVACISKLEDVVHISHTLRHVVHKRERLRDGTDAAEAAAVIAAEMQGDRFAALAQRIRSLKVSFIDFVFVQRDSSAAPRHRQ